MTWTILDTRRYIVSKTGAVSSLTICLIAGWYFFHVLISCLVNSLFAKRLTAAATSMPTQHHRSSSLWASSLQCWRCRDLAYRHTVDGQILSPVDMVHIPSFTGFHTCQLVVWDLWTIKQYWEITGGSVFFYCIRFLRFVLDFQFWHGQTPPYFIPRYRLPLHLQLWIDFISSNEAATTWIPQPNQCNCETNLHLQWLTWNLKIPPQKGKRETPIYYKPPSCLGNPAVGFRRIALSCMYDPSLSNRPRQVVVQQRIEIHPRKINESNLKMMVWFRWFSFSQGPYYPGFQPFIFRGVFFSVAV